MSPKNPGSEEPKAPLAGRYRFSRALSDRVWLATDLRSGQQALVGAVTSGDAKRFEKMRGLNDRHLSSVLLVQNGIPTDERPQAITWGESAVVTELVRGKSLARMLGDRTNMPAPRAVAWTLRLSRSLLRLREAEAAHGAISPAAIIDRGPGHPVAPVLSFFRAPALGLALSPEVLAGSEPTPADDVWSLGVCLYAALTGKYPFVGSTPDAVQEAVKRGPLSLSLQGVNEPLLQRILDEILASDPARRLRSVQELTATLDSYELENQLPAGQQLTKSTAPRAPSRAPLPRPVGKTIDRVTLDGVVFDPTQADAPGLREAAFRAPEPGPASASDHARISVPESPRPSESRITPPPNGLSMSPPSQHPFKRKKAVWPYFVALAALALGGGFYFLQQNNANVSPERPTTAGTASAASALEPKKPVPTVKKLNKAEKLDACVRSFFEDDLFAEDASFAFVCDAGPMYPTSQHLHELAEAKSDARLAAELAAAAAAATAAASAGVPPASSADIVHAGHLRRPLGWYELLATAIVRRSCCAPPPPVELTKTLGWCDQLDDVVSDLADDSARSSDLAPRVKRFDRAVDCLFANRVEIPYPDYVKKPLDDAQRNALQQFLGHAAVSEAKRRMLE